MFVVNSTHLALSPYSLVMGIYMNSQISEMRKIERKMTQKEIIQHKKLCILANFLYPQNCSDFTIFKEEYMMQNSYS